MTLNHSPTETASFHLHVDGGLYQLKGIAKNSNHQETMAVYEHIYPFEKNLWIRPITEFELRFSPIEPQQAEYILSKNREELSKQITQNKILRRLQEQKKDSDVITPAPQLHSLGFMFDPSATKVALIRKNTPAWQRGKLNGIGGKTEKGETSLQSLVREFFEETGVKTTHQQWRIFGCLQAPDFEVHVYTCFDAQIDLCQSTTNEKVEILPINHPSIFAEGLPGVPCLILASLDPHQPFYDIRYRQSALDVIHPLLTRVF